MCFFQDLQTFSPRLVDCLTQECGALLVKVQVFLFKFTGQLCRLCHFAFGSCKFQRESCFTRIDRLEYRLIQKTLEQPHQNQEIDDLCADGKPVDQHGLFSGCLSDDMVPERIGENQYHGDHETVNRD